MDVEIMTADPGEVDPEEVAKALEGIGFTVWSVTVVDRANISWGRWEATT